MRFDRVRHQQIDLLFSRFRLQAGRDIYRVTNRRKLLFQAKSDLACHHRAISDPHTEPELIAQISGQLGIHTV